MRGAILIALLALAMGVGLRADSLTIAWDAPADTSLLSGYEVLLGTASGSYNQVSDVGLVTMTTVSGLQTGVRYFVVVVSRDAAGDRSAYSNEVSGIPGPDVTPPPPPPPPPVPTIDPACVAPTGAKAVQVFPTALQKTGSGGAGSRARLDFQLSSPGSPITQVQIQGGGTTITTVSGADLTNLAGAWFITPTTTGTYPLAVVATNAYGCVKAQSSPFSVTVAAAPPPATSSCTPSPFGTTATTITDTACNVWTVDLSQGTTGPVNKNGVYANGAGSVLLSLASGIYVLGTDAHWYRWTGSTWADVGTTKPSA